MYPHNPRQQKLHQGFFLSFHFLQLTLMKGDKVVKLLQVIAQNSLLDYTWNSYNCVSHKFFIKIIYCAASSK